MKNTEELNLTLFEMNGEDKEKLVVDTLDDEYGYAPTSNMQKIDRFAKTTNAKLDDVVSKLNITKLSAIYNSTVNGEDTYLIKDNSIAEFKLDNSYLITFDKSNTGLMYVTLNSSVTSSKIQTSLNGVKLDVSANEFYPNTYYLFIYDGANFILQNNKKQNFKDENLKTSSKFTTTAINEVLDAVNTTKTTIVGSGLLINSNFSVWQRATSYTVTTTANYGGPDRWKFVSVSGSPVVSKLSNAGGLKCTGGSCKAMYLMDSGDLANVQGKVCSLSYKLNGNIKTSQITPTNQTVLSITLVNGDQLEWIKLELGTETTNYIPKKYQEELFDCQYYYWEFSGNTGLVVGAESSSAKAGSPIWYPRSMRSIPTSKMNFNYRNASGVVNSLSQTGAITLSNTRATTFIFPTPSDAPNISTIWLQSATFDAEL